MAEQIIDPTQSSKRSAAIRANRWVYRIARYWIFWFILIFGLFVLLPFLAPVLMAKGWELPGRVIYTVYSFLCHQLPQRSFFMFGPQFTYSLSDIQSAWQDTNNLIILRQFIGNPQMGWKVAWSDRMVSMYSSILYAGMAWFIVRRRLPTIGARGLFLFLLPMAIDGVTHTISDLAGIGQGFRDSNLWLASLTNYALPRGFYGGDAWGSFNSLMRLITGILFGIGVVWFGFPYFNEVFEDIQFRIRDKFKRAGLAL